MKEQERGEKGRKRVKTRGGKEEMEGGRKYCKRRAILKHSPDTSASMLYILFYLLGNVSFMEVSHDTIAERFVSSIQTTPALLKSTAGAWLWAAHERQSADDQPTSNHTET